MYSAVQEECHIQAITYRVRVLLFPWWLAHCVIRYAANLLDIQLTLTATVQKLYTMIRTNETRDLGAPQLDDSGRPIIHDIIAKLIRSCPDLPVACPDDTEKFNPLQAQRQMNRYTVKLTSSGNAYSTQYEEYNQTLRMQQHLYQPSTKLNRISRRVEPRKQ